MFKKKADKNMEMDTNTAVVSGEEAASEKGTTAVKEAKADKPSKPEKKKMAPKKKRRIIVLSVVGVIVLATIVNSVISSMKPVVVNTTVAKNEGIQEHIDLSGTVTAVNSKVYYSGFAGVLGEINVKKGDYVSAGDVLFTYDAEALEREMQLNEYKLQSAEGTYDNSVQSNGRVLGRLSEASTNLEVLEQQITDWEAYVQDLEKKIADKQAALANEGALLQISLIDWRDQPDSDEYINLQKLVQLNTYEQQYNAQIKEWQTQLTTAKEELAEFKSYKSQMISQENSSRDSAQTSGSREVSEATVETARLEVEELSAAYEAAADGVKAEFSGVITEVNAVAGSTVAKGAQLISMDSTEKVVVSVQVTKYDLEKLAIGQTAEVTVNGKTYSGAVDTINNIAEKNASGATVVGVWISIDEPDENIVLGLEGKAKVLIGEKSDALTVPVELLGYGSDGAFIMVVQDGVLVKRQVETGLSSSTAIEIISGLEPGDHIVTSETDNLTEGVNVQENFVEDYNSDNKEETESAITVTVG